MKNLDDRIAVITGASTGIGRAIAFGLADAGCIVVLLARGQDDLDKTVNEIKAKSGKAFAISADLRYPEIIRQTLAEIEVNIGPIDILVNNVGAGTFKPLHLTTNEECDLAIQLPYGTAMVASHFVARGMVERRFGHIVNMTSPAGIFPLPFMVPYTAARHAMLGMSHALYEELSYFGIGVSLICPAQVNTDYFERNDADMSWYPKISTLFPVLQPEDVADAVIKAIMHNRREVILTPVLKIFAATFRKAPRVSVYLLSALGLWRPARKLVWS